MNVSSKQYISAIEYFRISKRKSSTALEHSDTYPFTDALPN